MGKLVRVEALPREGIPFTFTESYRLVTKPGSSEPVVAVASEHGRGWPSGQAVSVEVLDQDHDADLITTEHTDRNTGRTVLRHVSDMTRIGRKSFEAVKANPFIRILSDADTVNEDVSKAIEVARNQAAEAAKRVVDLEMKVAALEDENRALKAKVTDLQGSLDQALAPAPKKPGTKDKAA